MKIVHHDGRADLAGQQGGPQLRVGGVEAAHEPHLDQPASDGALGADHRQRLVGGDRQRLFTQHRLAQFERQAGQFGMGAVGLAIRTASTSLRLTVAAASVPASRAPV